MLKTQKILPIKRIFFTPNLFYSKELNNSPQINKIKTLVSAAKKAQMACFIYGGVVRDLFLSEYTGSDSNNTDFDLMVDGNALDFASILITDLDLKLKKEWFFYNKPAVSLVSKDNFYSVSVVPFMGNGTKEERIFQDFCHSDFTLNMHTVELNTMQEAGMYSYVPDISGIDLDFLNRRLRLNPLLFEFNSENDFFLILLRALKYKYRDDLIIDTETIPILIEQISQQKEFDKRRHIHYLFKFFKSPFAKQIYIDIKNMGVLSILFPTLENLGFEQFEKEISKMEGEWNNKITSGKIKISIEL